MLGMTSCARIPASRCPEFPVPTDSAVDGILDYASGDSDILLWAEVNQVNIPLPIYERLLKDYSKHPDIELWMSRLLKLKQKLDTRNNP